MRQKQNLESWHVINGATASFAARLNYVVTLNGVTAIDIARAIGTDCGKVRSWMRGDSHPRLISFAKLCVFLGVSADWFLELGGVPPIPRRRADDGFLP